MMWWRVLLGVVAGLALVYLSLVALLWRAYRRDPNVDLLRASLRLLPDILGLLRRLAADPAVPRGVRIRLALLAGYLVMPIDLVPDFIPVLGYADDAVIVALALRSVIRHAGVDAVDRNWRGEPEGLRVVHRLAGVRSSR